MIKTIIVTLVTIISVYFILTIFLKESRHFLSFLPKQDTDFVLEIEINKEISSNVVFKKWLYSLIFTQEVLESYPEDKIRSFLNGRYDFAVARVNKSWVIGFRPIDVDKQDIVDVIKKSVLEIDSLNNIVDLSIGDNIYHLTYFEDFIVLSDDKDLLIDRIQDFVSDDNMSYQELYNVLPRDETITNKNIIYLKPKDYVLSMLNEFYLGDEISMRDFYKGDELVNEYVGNIFIDKKNLNVFFNEKIPHNRKNSLIESTQSIEDSDLQCSMAGYYAQFSGINFAQKWKNFNSQILDSEYSILGSLSYKYIQDILEKTEFDIESELILKMDNFYCLSLYKDLVDDKPFNSYVLVMKNDGGIDKDFLFKQLEYAYIRYAPTMKPIERAYELEDGTIAKELIIDPEKQINKEEISGGDIVTINFINEDSSSLSYGEYEDLIFISNSLERLKYSYDVFRKSYHSNQKNAYSELYNEKTKIVPAQILDDNLLGKYISKTFNQSLSNLFENIDEIILNKRSNGYIELNLKL